MLAGHIHLPKIALTLPVTGNTRNALQRLERFLKNKAIQPTLWYEGVANAVLATWKGREIELNRDQADLDDCFPLLFVALAFRKRAIPILLQLLPSDTRIPPSAQMQKHRRRLCGCWLGVVQFLKRSSGSLSHAV